VRIPLFQVDAFTNKLFQGNPAAVCPLESWLAPEMLQAIAAENNLSETAFFVKKNSEYELTWYTPEAEVDLCGHATLAAAYVVFHFLEKELTKVEFSTQSGTLLVQKDGALLSMDFPSRPPEKCNAPQALLKGLGGKPKEVLKSRDYMAVYESEEEVRSLQPNMDDLSQLDCTGIIVSAQGREVDFVSRFFAPKMGIPEDPVTGSAHCTLIPFWAKRLKKQSLRAHQISRRGGELFCTDLNDRVKIAGEAILYLEGFIKL